MWRSELSWADAVSAVRSKKSVRRFFLMAMSGFIFGAVNIYLNSDFLIDLIADNRRNPDVEILGPDPELRYSDQVSRLHLKRGGGFDRTGHVMQCQVTFHHDVINAILVYVDMAGINAAEGGLRILIAFYVVFIEMLLHQFLREDEPFQQCGKSQILLAGIDDRVDLVVLPPDIFQGSF